MRFLGERERAAHYLDYRRKCFYTFGGWATHCPVLGAVALSILTHVEIRYRGGFYVSPPLILRCNIIHHKVKLVELPHKSTPPVVCGPVSARAAHNRFPRPSNSQVLRIPPLVIPKRALGFHQPPWSCRSGTRIEHSSHPHRLDTNGGSTEETSSC